LAGYVAGMGDSYKALVGKLKKIDPFERSRYRLEMILKWSLKWSDGKMCIRFLWTNMTIGDRLQKPRYLNRAEKASKIRSRTQKTDIGKYSFVNRTIQVWNQLTANVLGTLLKTK
jgi:hypothetical protein